VGSFGVHPTPPSTDLDGLVDRFKKRVYAPVVLPRKFTLSRAERMTLNDYSRIDEEAPLIEGLMNRIGKKMGVTREEIMGEGQRREASMARSVFCYLASRNLGKTGRELSRALGLTPAAIHYLIMRGERYLDENGAVREEVANI
jgi:chromosomal replication initiation ATPase DnaA